MQYAMVFDKKCFFKYHLLNIGMKWYEQNLIINFSIFVFDKIFYMKKVDDK